MSHHPPAVMTSIFAGVHTVAQSSSPPNKGSLALLNIACRLKQETLNFHCHVTPSVTYCASRAYSVPHGGKGGKNTPVFSCTAVPEGVYTVSNLKQVGNQET